MGLGKARGRHGASSRGVAQGPGDNGTITAGAGGWLHAPRGEGGGAGVRGRARRGPAPSPATNITLHPRARWAHSNVCSFWKFFARASAAVIASVVVLAGVKGRGGFGMASERDPGAYPAGRRVRGTNGRLDRLGARAPQHAEGGPPGGPQAGPSAARPPRRGERPRARQGAPTAGAAGLPLSTRRARRRPPGAPGCPRALRGSCGAAVWGVWTARPDAARQGRRARLVGGRVRRPRGRGRRKGLAARGAAAQGGAGPGGWRLAGGSAGHADLPEWNE
jgi:hypothetical protein